VSYLTPFSPYLMNELYETCPIIIDPINGHNASKSSFRIDEVRDSFARASNYLNDYKIKYDKYASDNNQNIIYDLLLS
jgi:hypothetical protein